LPQPILQRSISDYYYTPVGNYLVGSLAVIAAFVFCSRGYDLSDEITGYLAGASTLGVAILPPVNPRGGYTQLQVDIGFAHTGFAALMFLPFSLSQNLPGKEAHSPQAAQEQPIRNLRLYHRYLHDGHGEPHSSARDPGASTHSSDPVLRIAGVDGLRRSVAYQGRRLFEGQAAYSYRGFLTPARIHSMGLADRALRQHWASIRWQRFRSRGITYSELIE
jgi:hypothetical protein